MIHILVLCTGNSARSILGEALLNAAKGGGVIKAYSAGSKPTGLPNRYALETLQRHGHDTGFARSKSWDEFEGPDAPAMDAVITVCDSAASETCPIWPGAPVRAHWGLPDPAAETEPEAARLAFQTTYDRIERAVEVLMDQGADLSDPAQLKAALEAARP